MLYRTSRHPLHLPLPLRFNSIPFPLQPPYLLPFGFCSHHLFSSKVLTEMERVEAAVALKASLCRESFSGLSGNPLALAFDEFNGSSGVPADDFSVDELLDLSNVNVFVDDEEEEEPQQRAVEVDEKASVSGFSKMDDFPSVSAGELSVPADDAADLEWLSNFVEDSSEYSTPFPAGMLPEKPWIHDPSGPGKPGFNELPCFTASVPAKARSKRARTGGRLWFLGSTPPSFSESSGSSSSTSSTISSSPPSPWVGLTNVGLIEPVYGKPPVKKAKKRVNQWSGQQPRRCSHCGVNKTPQWRAGPNGAKTLCNACGVRFKSGRLLPEYRPACSPTFSSELHSNHHRKVLEMRRKKDSMSDQPEPGLVVPIF